MRSFTVACVLLLAACSSTRIGYVAVNQPPHPVSPRSPDSVEVFTDARPDRPFVDVATFDVEVMGIDRSPDALAKLRSRAADVGCEGLIISDSMAFAHGKYTASCIVYSNP
jgi:hypothetical protein